jgi:uncharacterized Zn finger protein (UPF0148 family)
MDQSMITVICAVCGEPVLADDQVCPVCEASELRAVPAEQLPPTPQERLIANAHRTVERINDLHTARTQQLDEDAKARIGLALRARAEDQLTIIEARLHEERERLRAEQERVDTAIYHEALSRLKRELQALL